MRAFLITYEGLWLGGKSVVIAESAEQAVALVEKHEATCCFAVGKQDGHLKPAANAPTCTELSDLASASVLYNDNGDY